MRAPPTPHFVVELPRRRARWRPLGGALLLLALAMLAALLAAACGAARPA